MQGADGAKIEHAHMPALLWNRRFPYVLRVISGSMRVDEQHLSE